TRTLNFSTCLTAAIQQLSMVCRLSRGQTHQRSPRCYRSCQGVKAKWESVWSSSLMCRKRIRSYALFLLTSLILSPLAKCQEQALKSSVVLRERLNRIASSFPGKIGMFVRNLETNEEVGIHSDDQFPMASTYKVAIMVEVFREAEARHLSLTERVQLSESDRR